MSPSLPIGTTTVHGPGRVNLIGDHTDYNSGLALPLAIGLGVDVQWEETPRSGESSRVDGAGTGTSMEVASASFPDDVGRISLPVVGPVEEIQPPWARLVAAMSRLAAQPESSGRLRITSSLPVGAGLSSSAALCVALARLWAVDGTPLEIAELCQRAEHLVGVPVGLMDPWVAAGGVAGHALLLDFGSTTATPIALPETAQVVVVDSGVRRHLRTAPYADRVAECRSAEAIIGPLGLADEASIGELARPAERRRARHVVSECARVRSMGQALVDGDLGEAGALLDASHRSLSQDFEVSTPEIDAMVAWLRDRPGVLGARLTGAGFGGCIVLLVERSGIDVTTLATFGHRAWAVEAVDGAFRRR